MPVADWSSLEEAQKIVGLLEKWGVGSARARVVFTLVDRRSRVGGADGPTLYHRLRDEVRRRGWAYYKTPLSRSPRVETLNSGSSMPLSILHRQVTEVHAQSRSALEVLGDSGSRSVVPRAPIRPTRSDDLGGARAP